MRPVEEASEKVIGSLSMEDEDFERIEWVAVFEVNCQKVRDVFVNPNF